MESSDHLFRREAGRVVAVLTRIFGVHNLALAEDVVQEAFCRALEVWKFRGMPENPAAWLMATARNCALDALRRDRTARSFAPELARLLDGEATLEPVIEELFDPNAIKDDLLRMMFTCCQPRLGEETQVALVLHILCGFSAGEVAGAFLSTQAAMQKRIVRAKSVLADSRRLFDVTRADEFVRRLPAVHRTLYLLFSEGYHGGHPESAIRSELCREAMRLTALLLEHPLGATPTTSALAALMCFGAARLPARLDTNGELSSLFDQDRSLWDRELIAEGARFLELSASGGELTVYHVEAAIAATHARAEQPDATDWRSIVALYDSLMTIGPSPIVALNRAVAIAQRDGAEQGLRAIAAIADRERLTRYPFYHAALGELELRCQRTAAADCHFRTALSLARNPAERRFFERRIGAVQLPLA